MTAKISRAGSEKSARLSGRRLETRGIGSTAEADAIELRRHFRRPRERAFTRSERDRVVLLFGGLTRRHDRLIRAALEGLGYRAEPIEVPTKADFQAGREYGNVGQCNPTYFTVGALINYLTRLRDEQGLPTERILSDYAFVTCGSCGPCRFGMYEAEHRLALQNAGFDGFRVLVFDQDRGPAQSAEEAGLELNPAFFLGLLNAVFIGDLLNALAFHIRPYETVPGRTDAVFEKCLAVCEEALRARHPAARAAATIGRLLARIVPGNAQRAAPFLEQLSGRHYVRALERCRAMIDAEIEVDYTRAKPLAKITGEFWAQTTEGDGNFHMFRFLEAEGAEVLVETVTTWVDYTLHYWRQYGRDRRGLAAQAAPRGSRNLRARLEHALAYHCKQLGFAVARWALVREYERMRRSLGATAHPLACQLDLQRMGHPYYNSRSSGGEGHLEVAKNIYYFNRRQAHIVLSLKPFGCMPSTQSDGAQAAVLAHHPDMLFLPVETCGDGDIDAYSRVQMALGQAKAVCRQEFATALARTGFTLEDIRAYVAAHPALRRPLQRVPRAPGVIGRAANFIPYVAGRLRRDPRWSARRLASEGAAER